MFARLNANHDGVITKAEANAMKGQVEANVEKVPQRLDGAKILAAGRQSRRQNHPSRSGPVAARTAKAGKVVSNGKHGFAGLFAHGDTNKDGMISRSQFGMPTGQTKAQMEKLVRFAAVSVSASSPPPTSTRMAKLRLPKRSRWRFRTSTALTSTTTAS